MMGGEVPLEELLLHEMGHALQLESGSMSLASRMSFWASLSGFTESKSKEPTNGFVGGMNTSEHTMVLIRLLLADDPAKVSRGSQAHYQHAPQARFVNRYTRYDLREGLRRELSPHGLSS